MQVKPRHEQESKEVNFEESVQPSNALIDAVSQEIQSIAFCSRRIKEIGQFAQMEREYLFKTKNLRLDFGVESPTYPQCDCAYIFRYS